jgi:ADP-ribose pyrophosphatase YjhB (NUDIX family)
MIHYQNPKMVIGAIPVWEADGLTQILLCKRAIEPRYGLWTLPGGFMENNETTAAAAMRETQEESGAHITLENMFTLLNVPQVHQVHIFYRATLLDLDFAAGEESLEVKLFTQQEIPWDELAFPTVRKTLKFFFEDHAKVKAGTGQYEFHTHDILKRKDRPD